jgi:16S rRNA C967 or C1407 C5-methylase (RsmB/RsmF family)
MKKTFFPKEFISKYSLFCRDEWDNFFKIIKTKQPKSFWINNKFEINKVLSSLKKQNVYFENYPFSKQAFFTNYARPGELNEFKEGKISIQEKAAMLCAVALNPSKNDVVLDACAAPGMKTIQLSNFSKKVVACEINKSRIKSLFFNKKKYFLDNVSIRNKDVLEENERFDKILLDAPCSSEGLVRKKRDALKNWSEALILRKSKKQRELILHCFDLLKPKGEMIYATCSFSKEENEDVVNFLLKNRPNAILRKVNLKGIKIRQNLLCKNCVRLWPMDNNTQQFFFVKIQKSK